MNCDLFDVGMTGRGNCTPVIPGTGAKAYLFDVDECFPTKIPVPKEGNKYDWNELLHGCVSSDPGLDGNLFGVKIKPLSGHPTGTREQGKKFASSVFEGLVENDLDAFAALDAVLPYRNIGLLTSDNSGACYVFMSPYSQPLYNSSFEGGTDTSTEAGTTFTLTYVSGFLATKVDVPDGENLDQYLDSRKGNANGYVVTFTASPTGGKIAVFANGVAIKSGDTILQGTDMQITATPNSGKRIDFVKVGDTTVSPNPYRFKMPGSAVTITAAFEDAD